MKLFVMRGCPFGQRALVALGEKRVPFERVVFERGQRPAELEALSPRAKSPTLVDGEVALFDSQVILEYIEERHPEPPLMPSSPAGRAEVRALVARVGEELLPKFHAVMSIAMKRKSDAPPDEPGFDDAKRAFASALAAWDRALEGRTFLVGAAPTIADIVLYTLFPAAERLSNVDIPEDLRNLRAWRDRMATRPSAAPA